MKKWDEEPAGERKGKGEKKKKKQGTIYMCEHSQDNCRLYELQTCTNKIFKRGD